MTALRKVWPKKVLRVCAGRGREARRAGGRYNHERGQRGTRMPLSGGCSKERKVDFSLIFKSRDILSVAGRVPLLYKVLGD